MPSPDTPRTPGYRFKDGRLMIFQEDEVMLIRGWDEPSAVRKNFDVWESFTPDFRLVAPYRRAAKPSPKKGTGKPAVASAEQLDLELWGAGAGASSDAPKQAAPKPLPLAEQRKKAFDSFRFSLPKEIARALEPFRSHQWPLLVLLAHDKRVADLAEANPVLAYAVADWYADYPRSKLDFGRMPQRALLKLLKLPDSAAVVKLLKKIPPESVDRRLWPALLTALRKPDGSSSKLLAHVPSINLGVMELILTPQIRAALTPSLLEEVAADPKEKYRGTTARLIYDTVAMKEELGDARPLPGMKSITQLRRYHAETWADYQKLDKLRKEHGVLPPPPLPGLKGKIVPLRTQAELVGEGREQKNCVATYAAGVAAGKCFIYRVLYPSRATLCIRLQSDGNWGISQLEASCNRKADTATHEFVKQWLEPYRIGI
jgi:hypothetical protein